VRLREATGSLLVDVSYGDELRGIQSFDKASMVCRDLAAADNADAQPCLPFVIGVYVHGVSRGDHVARDKARPPLQG